jgi:hypothetical protein
VNCLGVLDRDPNRAPGTPPIEATYDPHPYGSSFMRCNNLPVPRGTMGRLPWTHNLDLNVAYAPNWAEGLQFKIDVFNVLNAQEVTSVNEQAEVPETGLTSETYLQPFSFQAPRTIRVMVQYDF